MYLSLLRALFYSISTPAQLWFLDNIMLCHLPFPLLSPLIAVPACNTLHLILQCVNLHNTVHFLQEAHSDYSSLGSSSSCMFIQNPTDCLMRTKCPFPLFPRLAFQPLSCLTPKAAASSSHEAGPQVALAQNQRLSFSTLPSFWAGWS